MSIDQGILRSQGSFNAPSIGTQAGNASSMKERSDEPQAIATHADTKATVPNSETNSRNINGQSVPPIRDDIRHTGALLQLAHLGYQGLHACSCISEEHHRVLFVEQLVLHACEA